MGRSLGLDLHPFAGSADAFVSVKRSGEGHGTKTTE